MKLAESEGAARAKLPRRPRPAQGLYFPASHGGDINTTKENIGRRILASLYPGTIGRR